MKSCLSLILWYCTVCQCLAQATLVKMFPTDTVDLSCAQCITEITAAAITKGQQSIPINLDKPVKNNLLHWSYYDDIAKEEVVMEEKPVWTEGQQLVDKLSEGEILSYHINLKVKDTVSQKEHRVFLVLSGINRKELRALPLECTYDPDTYAIFRFSAIAQTLTYQIQSNTYEKVTFDCVDGTCIFEDLDTQNGRYNGTFNFTASRIGMEQRTVFVNGHILVK